MECIRDVLQVKTLNYTSAYAEWLIAGVDQLILMQSESDLIPGTF